MLLKSRKIMQKKWGGVFSAAQENYAKKVGGAFSAAQENDENKVGVYFLQRRKIMKKC